MRKIQILLFSVCSMGFLMVLPRLEGMTPPEPPSPSVAPPPAHDVTRAIAVLTESSRRQEASLAALGAGLERLDLRIQSVQQSIVTEVRSLQAAQARLEAGTAASDDGPMLKQLEEIHRGIVETEARLEKLGPLEERVRRLERRADSPSLKAEVEHLRERVKRIELDRIQMLGKLLETSTPVPPARNKRPDDDD